MNNKAEEVLRKCWNAVYSEVSGRDITDEQWKAINDEDAETREIKKIALKAMKEYAEYIAKCAHRDLRHSLCEDYFGDGEGNFDLHIMNHQFVKPKELE